MLKIWAAILIATFLTVAAMPIWVQADNQTPEPKDMAMYKIGPGDVLEISVWEDQALQREVVVPPDGVISFPLVGDINVNGMTVTDLRSILKDRLQEFIRDATVTVTFRSVISQMAYVIGKVNNPGRFPIDMDTTVMQVLAMAGGLNAFADGDEIKIIRRDNGQSVQYKFDYDEVECGRNMEQNIVLKRGDVIVVP